MKDHQQEKDWSLAWGVGRLLVGGSWFEVAEERGPVVTHGGWVQFWGRPVGIDDLGWSHSDDPDDPPLPGRIEVIKVREASIQAWVDPGDGSNEWDALVMGWGLVPNEWRTVEEALLVTRERCEDDPRGLQIGLAPKTPLEACESLLALVDVGLAEVGSEAGDRPHPLAILPWTGFGFPSPQAMKFRLTCPAWVLEPEPEAALRA